VGLGTDINTLGDAAVAAIEAADWDTAETKLLALQTKLAVTPDVDLQGHSVRYGRDTIDQLIRRVTKTRAATAGIQYSRVTYGHPTDG
jgi:hypothetical protein